MNEEMVKRLSLFYTEFFKIIPNDSVHEEITLEKGDLVVAGYPKSGTTWMQQILHQLRSKGDNTFDSIHKVTGGIDYYFRRLRNDIPPITQTDQPYRPRIFKCHDNQPRLPRGPEVKYIAIVRNRLDVIWSGGKYLCGLLGGKAENFDAEDMIRLKSQVSYPNPEGNYIDWILSWYPHRNDPDVLWVHYEDLVENLPVCVRKIAAFIGVALDEDLERLVVEQSSHQYMAAHKSMFETTVGSGEEAMKAAMMKKGIEWTPVAGPIVRTDGGTVGQGKEKSPPALVEHLANEWAATIGAKLGIASYEELRSRASLLHE